RTVKVNFEQLCQLETTYNAQAMSGDLNLMNLNLFDDVNFSVQFYEIEKTFSDGFSYVGYIAGIPAGEVVMVRNEGILSATINTGERLFQVKYLTGDLHQIKEIRPGSYPTERQPQPVPINLAPDDEKINEVLDTGNYIDVMVLYTSTARSAVGGTSAMGNLINLAVTETNTGYNNSGVTQRLRLVHTVEVSYSETGFDWDIALDRLRGETDGYMDNIHTLRDTYGADEVVLIVSATDYCGMGYLMSTLSSYFEAYAFCLVSIDCATGYYSFAHELGHNMGSHHDRANAGSEGAYSYSYGYQAPDESFRTIMAYDCPTGCPRVNYWSNPDKTYGGQPMGVVYTAPDAADNRRSLNNTLSTVRNFRQAQVSSSSITVISPNGGETWAAGSSQTVTWTSSGSITNVKIEYSTNNGSTWTTVISSTANDGSYSWTVPSVSSTQCKIRIKEAATGTPSDTSNAVFSIVSSSSPTITVTSPNGGENLTAGSSHTITWSTTGTVGNVKIQYSTNNGSSWSNVVTSTANDGSHKWTVPSVSSTQCRVKIFEASDSSPSDTSNNVFTISTGSAPKITLNRTQFYFGALRTASKTGGQTLRISNTGGGTLSWNISSSQAWLSGSPTSGTGAGVVTLNVNHSSLAAGTYTGTITVAASGASNTPRTVSVTLTVKNSSSDQYPFGEFSSPTNGSYVSSSIPVTGWVLDDIDVASVKIYNGSTYIGDAVFVEGARPDVAAAYSNYPKNYQAGWGYMLLSHFLPNGGDGTYTLYAKATDSEGHVKTLGSKVIYCNNSDAEKPFGAIDTPAQGGNASGSNYTNSGWVLTPKPNTIPTNGSTIEVYIDSVKKGTATYNQYRSDIASLFPGYKNTNGAGAFFKFNTTGYSNGVHTIFWIVTDNAGNADGIGSRFFIVQNTGADMDRSVETLDSTGSIANINLATDTDLNKPVTVTKGYRRDAVPQTLYAGDEKIDVVIHELERVVIDFGYPVSPVQTLPVGSTLDNQEGIFYWNPGPGFIGDYQLQFSSQDNQLKQVNIKILPKQ
ncbi:MAG: M12 family metallo-peptidase, partial [Acidobacteria bacterium]|nr:M12 family metallo-peptidase [Acidobacteriota bacterium]